MSDDTPTIDWKAVEALKRGDPFWLSQGDLFATTLEAIKQLRAERDALRAALTRIRDHEGKVCDQYEVCEHRACQSSYAAWAIADAALSRGGDTQ